MKTKIKKMQDGGSKKKKTVKSSTPFQNYMRSTPGATASDTSQTFTGSRNTDNAKLDKAYNETYYAGRENERRTGADAVKYNKEGKRIRKTGGTMKTKMKTGGMVNPNAKMQADKTAGSKGVKSGVNPKAAASKVAKGRSGGTSAAPKAALPKAQMVKIVNLTSKVAKAAGKGAKKASGSVLDFRKAATKSDMSKAFSNIERANLKKQLQDLEKAKKG